MNGLASLRYEGGDGDNLLVTDLVARYGSVRGDAREMAEAALAEGITFRVLGLVLHAVRFVEVGC